MCLYVIAVELFLLWPMLNWLYVRLNAAAIGHLCGTSIVPELLFSFWLCARPLDFCDIFRRYKHTLLLWTDHVVPACVSNINDNSAIATTTTSADPGTLCCCVQRTPARTYDNSDFRHDLQRTFMWDFSIIIIMTSRAVYSTEMFHE